MPPKRALSLNPESKKTVFAPISKRQHNYITKKINQKFNDLTQSFLSSRGESRSNHFDTQNQRVKTAVSNQRVRTSTSATFHHTSRQNEFLRSTSQKKNQIIKQPYLIGSTKDEKLDKIFNEYILQMSIPLKPVPKNFGRKSSFGWLNTDDKQRKKQQITFSKIGRSYSIVVKRNKNQWVQTLKELKKEFEFLSPKLQIFPKESWAFLFEKFQNFHLNINEKQQLIELFCKFLERKTDSSKDVINQFIKNYFGISKSNEFLFCEEVGGKFQKMQNRIYFKHKYCLQCAKFMASPNLHSQRFYPIYFSEFKFDLNETEVFELFKTVRQFCQNNMDAFAFITLYFQISIKKLLTKSPFKHVQELYKKILKQIEKKYPPSQEEKIENLFSFKFDKLSTLHQYEKLYFTDQKSHFEQLKEFVLKKAEDAKSEQTRFRKLVEDTCFIHGYSFKSGVKIKSAENEACVFRTIEKLMDKSKFKPDFDRFKQSRSQTNSQINNISERIRIETEQAQNAMSQILEKEEFIEFDAKDLVRGKCTFSKVEEIQETVNSLKEHIENEGCKIIEIKNRLKKGTKDVSLIIQLEKSIAELQLALKLDSVSNQFNHKIFELTRSHIHEPIINLFIHNQRWCETFFTEQCQVFQTMISVDQEPDLRDVVTFKQLKRDIATFKRDFLETNAVVYEKNFKSKQEEKIKLVKKINQVKEEREKLNESNQKGKVSKNSLRQNLINFYKCFDCKMALETIEQIDDEEIVKNPILLKLKSEILRLNSKYKDSLESYKKYIEIYCPNKEKNLQMADIYHIIGSIYDVQQNSQQAIEYYEKSLQIKEVELKGKNDIEIAATLDGIGEVFSNLKTKEAYQHALEYHFKALKIRQEYQGKQGKESLETATSLNNIGVVYRRQFDYQNSLSYLEQSLEMRKRLSGKESMDAATSLYNIGVLYHCKNDPKKALEYLSQSIDIIEKIMGKESIDLARGYVYVSYVYEKLDEFEKAQEAISVAHSVFKKILGEEHHKTQLSYQHYTDIRTKLARKWNISTVGGSKIYKRRSSISSVSSGEYTKLKLLS